MTTQITRKIATSIAARAGSEIPITRCPEDKSLPGAQISVLNKLIGNRRT